MRVVKRWRLFKGIFDSNQAAVSPQAEVDCRPTAAYTWLTRHAEAKNHLISATLVLYIF